MPSLPSGTVTLVFTDIVGSTRLWEAHPTARMPIRTEIAPKPADGDPQFKRHAD